MKTLFSTALIALIAVCTVANFSGCATPERTREAVLFDTCKSTYAAARGAYKATVKLHLTGKLTDAQRGRADYGWVQFQNSFAVTFEALSLNWNSATPEQLQRLTDDFLNLLKSL